MKASIIVRAYNEGEHIEKLLLGIHAQSLSAHEIILVDSGSTDDTALIAKKYGAKVVSIRKQDFTFGRALNVGCEAASGDILVIVSAHVYPTFEDWLERLVAPFADQKVVLSYGRQRGNHRNKFSEHQIFARWFPSVSVSSQNSYFCNNANCAIRRSAWLQQAYDEELTGLEDLAWAKAIKTKGGHIAYEATAEIVHVHDETWSQVLNRYRREAIAMRAIDEHAKFTRLDLVGLVVRNVISDAGEAIKQGVLLKEWASILRFRYNQFLGTFMGYNGPSELTAELRSRFYYPTVSGDRAPVDAISARTHRQLDYERLLANSSVADLPGPQMSLK